jgi:hypothetical protein
MFRRAANAAPNSASSNAAIRSNKSRVEEDVMADWMQSLFHKAGVISKTVPTVSLIDTSVHDDAVKLSGK